MYYNNSISLLIILYAKNSKDNFESLIKLNQDQKQIQLYMSSAVNSVTLSVLAWNIAQPHYCSADST